MSIGIGFCELHWVLNHGLTDESYFKDHRVEAILASMIKLIGVESSVGKDISYFLAMFGCRGVNGLSRPGESRREVIDLLEQTIDAFYSCVSCVGSHDKEDFFASRQIMKFAKLLKAWHKAVNSPQKK